MSLLETFRGGTSDCEPPLSRIVLKMDLKDAYKSGKFNSSKVKRRGTSVGFRLTTAGAAAEETATEGPTGTGAWVGTGPGQEKEETDTGKECSGKDNVEREEATVEVGRGETEKLGAVECEEAKEVTVGEG